MPNAKRAKTTSSPSEVGPRIVQLNVGGVHHQVSDSLLANMEPCMLSLLVSDRWQGQHTLDAEGRIFIDRDGLVFRDVLNFIRSGPYTLKYMSERDLHKLRIEADYYGLVALQNAIEDKMLETAGHGNPVVMTVDGWARTQGQVRGDGGFSSWGWLKTSGNRSILHQDPDVNFTKYIIGETGTYLILVRLYTSPHYRLQPNQRYPQIYDEFARVDIQRRGTGPRPSWNDDDTVARFGTWDHRNLEETNSDPAMATFTCVEVVTLLEGDVISIAYPNGRSSNLITYPVPADFPPELVNSFTLIKLHGDSIGRFERKRVPNRSGDLEKARAAWVHAGLTMPDSPLKFKLSNEDTTIKPQAGGNYLVTGRIAVAVKESADESSAEWNENHPVGHVPQFRAKLPCGRVIHTNHTVFLSACSSDRIGRGNLSENGSFQDVVCIKEGCSVEFVAEGETILANHGTTNDPCGKIPSQSLSMMLLSHSMEFDRYRTKVVNEVELTWKRAVSCLGGEHGSPLFECDSDVLEYQGETAKTVLVMGWFPPLEEVSGMVLTHNSQPVSFSQTLENSGHSHNFHEILEIEEGDCISVKELSLDPARSWQDAWEGTDDAIKFEAQAKVGGYLCFVVLA